jgi:hypothetical protein
MANQKISELTDGGTIQATDNIPVERSSANRKVRFGAATGTVGQKAGYGTGGAAQAFTDKKIVSIPHGGENKTFAFKVPFAGTITKAGGFTDTGTINALVRIGIGGTTVTGLAAVALDDSESGNDDTATAANTFSAGSIIEVVTSGASGSPTAGSVFVHIDPTGLPTA